MSQSTLASGSRSHRDGGSGYDGQGLPVPYRTGPLAYTPAVLCACKNKLKACRWISWSDGNPGRRYYSCQRAKNPKEDCSFFHWIDAELSTWYKELLRDLRDRIWELKNDLDDEDAKLQAKDRQLVAMQIEVEEKEVQDKHLVVEQKEQELNAKLEKLAAKEQQLQALEANLKKKNQHIGALLLLCLLLVIMLVLVMLNVNKA